MILAIDTATTACSVAMIEGTDVIAKACDHVGRGHAERLIPMIAELPGGGRANTVLVNCGPGSFTGVRVGIAAARGLALGWDVPVYGYSTHALIAAQTFAEQADQDQIAVIMEGGHGEVFVQEFLRSPFGPVAPLASLLPEAAMASITTDAVFGNAALAGITQALPLASAAALLAETFRTLAPQPIYGREPDAKPVAA